MKEIITIETLPEEIYVELEKDFHNKLWENVSSITVKKLSKELSIPLRNLYKYKETKSGYPLKHLKRFLAYTDLMPNNITIKPQRDAKRLQANLPIKCSIEFAGFLGHLLGDGGIDKQFQVHYTSNREDFLDRFDYLLHKVFGKVEKKTYDYGTRKTYYYPKIIGQLLKSIDIPVGNKVDSNASIPIKILNMFDPKMKIEFIKAFYECDGESKQIRIIQGGKVADTPKILIQIKNMLCEFGFKSVIIEPSTTYHTQRGEHRRWVLKIKNRTEKIKFVKIINPSKLSWLIIGSRV